MLSKTTYQLEQELAEKDRLIAGYEACIIERDKRYLELQHQAEELHKNADRYLVLRNSGRYSPCPFGNGWGLGRGSNPDDLDKAVDEYAASVAQAKKEGRNHG